MRPETAAARIAELEAILVRERAETERRKKQVESRIIELRITLFAMRENIERGGAERKRLMQQIEEQAVEIERLREQSAGPAGPAGPSPVTAEAMTVACAEIERLMETVRELEAERSSQSCAEPPHAEIRAVLELEIARRDKALHVAAEKTTSQQRRLAALEKETADQSAQIGALLEETTVLRNATHEAEKKAREEEIRAEAAVAAAAAATQAADAATRAAADAAARLATEAAARQAAPKPAEEAGARVAAAVPAVACDDGFPDVPGVRREGAAETSDLGTRWRARETASRRPVAVLVLPRPMADVDGKKLDALLLARHENLAQVLSFGVGKAGPYVVHERAQGETLEQWVYRVGALPERTALPVALQVARGLRQAALHGALHGELSPRAVRIDPQGLVKVEDAGFTSLLPSGSRAPSAPSFASPERLRSGTSTDARSDIYSLGALLYFLLTAHAPFPGDREKVQRQQSAASRPDAREWRPDVPEATAQYIMRLMAAMPDDRPASWDEVVAELERRVPGHAPRDAARSRLAEAMSANPYPFLAVAAAPLVAVAALLFAVIGSGPTPRERFDVAAEQADALVKQGDVAGARVILARFVKDAGDPAVEREAAGRLETLKGK